MPTLGEHWSIAWVQLTARWLLAGSLLASLVSACNDCSEGELKCDGTALYQCKQTSGHVPDTIQNLHWEKRVDCADIGAECRVPKTRFAHPGLSEGCVLPDVQCSPNETSVCLPAVHDFDWDTAGKLDIVVDCNSPTGEPTYQDTCGDPEACVASEGTARCQAGTDTCSTPDSTKCLDDEHILKCSDGVWRVVDRCWDSTPCYEVPDAGALHRAACSLIAAPCNDGDQTCLEDWFLISCNHKHWDRDEYVPDLVCADGGIATP